MLVFLNDHRKDPQAHGKYRCSTSPGEYLGYRIFTGNGGVTIFWLAKPRRTRSRIASDSVVYLRLRIKIGKLRLSLVYFGHRSDPGTVRVLRLVALRHTRTGGSALTDDEPVNK